MTFKEKLTQAVPKKIDPAALPVTTLFTMEGCPHCKVALEQYKPQIDAGDIVVQKCDPNGSAAEQETCRLAGKQVNFDGYPSMYDPDGKKLL